MRLSDIASERVVLILGAPRSGTTWLAKIFDSHPDVLYRHEPDTVLRATDLPWVCDRADIPRHLDAARAYLAVLIDTATVKTAGSLPMFPKRFESLSVRLQRRAIIHALRLAALTRPGRRLAANIPVPDPPDLARHPALRVAIKSVGALGRAGLFAAALPHARIVVIVRDAWGQVASMRRGAAGGKFEASLPIADLVDPPRAAQYGLTPALFATLPDVEQFAWNWAILNRKAIDDLDGMDRVKLLRYQDLCEHPVEQARALLEFAGLSWEPETEEFLRRSTSHVGPARYYAVFRDTEAALYRWRQDLSPEDQRRIHAVVCATSLTAFCPEFNDPESNA
jgi:hypothetical protein